MSKMNNSEASGKQNDWIDIIHHYAVHESACLKGAAVASSTFCRIQIEFEAAREHRRGQGEALLQVSDTKEKGVERGGY